MMNVCGLLNSMLSRDAASEHIRPRGTQLLVSILPAKWINWRGHDLYSIDDTGAGRVDGRLWY